jgi:hypothetical protein
MSTYDTDYYAWTQETIEKLRQGKLSEINTQDLIEELEDMAGRTRRELGHRLSVLLGHLLKWQYQPESISYSWQGSINTQRDAILELLLENPSLKPKITEFIVKAYSRGIQIAVKETNLPEETFPSSFEQTGWSWEQVLDMDFFPGGRLDD